ncbi:hypothetical protein [Methylorubrum thiocyanatum]|uniref:hypothetical protein n=1 Tax=Methylorubrum thiocyanatum TaxID=47958 RepID=UPI0035C8788A
MDDAQAAERYKTTHFASLQCFKLIESVLGCRIRTFVITLGIGHRIRVQESADARISSGFAVEQADASVVALDQPAEVPDTLLEFGALAAGDVQDEGEEP